MEAESRSTDLSADLRADVCADRQGQFTAAREVVVGAGTGGDARREPQHGATLV